MAGCDTRSFFKQNIAGLNSEFFFSYTGCLTKAKETSLPFIACEGGQIDSYFSEGY